MSNADDIFWRRFGMILAVLTLFGFVVAFIARDIAGDAHQTSMNSPAAVAERIAPMGTARVGDPGKIVAAAPAADATPVNAAAATDSGPIDAEKLYNANCMACHAAGVAGAPKKGDDAAWAPRIALGEDALVNSVVKGKGAMPPNAGNPKLNEAQIRATVQYLTGVGGDSALASAKEAVADATEAVKDAAATAGSAAQQAVEAVKDVAGTAATTVGQAAGAVSSTVADATTAAAAAAAASSAAATMTASAGKPGKDVYNMGCVACHASGAANAPKLDDKAAWETRAATGMAAMVNSVIKGKGAMPPRGALMTLEDADIENAVRYMLKEAGVEAGS